jgi:hypothetical protein
MPWCADCDRFYNPNTLSADGDCPNGHHVEDVSEGKPEKLNKFRDEPTPWHFKVLLVAVAIYLSWRFVQMGSWVAHHV